MPKPPILPVIEWKAVFDAAMEWDVWIEQGENAENRAKMKVLRDSLEPGAKILDAARAIAKTVHVLAIAEDWCPDVVRHVPPAMRLAAANPNIKVRFMAREDRPDVFARFLTNGGEAVPKFVFLSADFVECGSWGPMDSASRRVISQGKACNDVKSARKKVAAMYAADAQCRVAFEEMMQLIAVAGCGAVDRFDDAL